MVYKMKEVENWYIIEEKCITLCFSSAHRTFEMKVFQSLDRMTGNTTL